MALRQGGDRRPLLTVRVAVHRSEHQGLRGADRSLLVLLVELLDKMTLTFCAALWAGIFYALMMMGPTE